MSTTTPKKDTVQLIAIALITEQRDGAEVRFQNGAIFETTPELAEYYRTGGYARPPLPEELPAADASTAGTNRQSTPTVPGAAIPSKRSYLRRDVTTRK